MNRRQVLGAVAGLSVAGSVGAAGGRRQHPRSGGRSGDVVVRDADGEAEPTDATARGTTGLPVEIREVRTFAYGLAVLGSGDRPPQGKPVVVAERLPGSVYGALYAAVTDGTVWFHDPPEKLRSFLDDRPVVYLQGDYYVFALTRTATDAPVGFDARLLDDRVGADDPAVLDLRVTNRALDSLTVTSESGTPFGDLSSRGPSSAVTFDPVGASSDSATATADDREWRVPYAGSLVQAYRFPASGTLQSSVYAVTGSFTVEGARQTDGDFVGAKRLGPTDAYPFEIVLDVGSE